jgi:hypothetical protein
VVSQNFVLPNSGEVLSPVRPTPQPISQWYLQKRPTSERHTANAVIVKRNDNEPEAADLGRLPSADMNVAYGMRVFVKHLPPEVLAFFTPIHVTNSCRLYSETPDCHSNSSSPNFLLVDYIQQIKKERLSRRYIGKSAAEGPRFRHTLCDSKFFCLACCTGRYQPRASLDRHKTRA